MFWKNIAPINILRYNHVMTVKLPRSMLTMALLLLFFLLIPAGIFSQDFFNWSVLGSMFYFAADNGVNSDPAPILPSLGGSVSLRLNNFLRLELTEDVYFTNYEYNYEYGYPMACNPENRSAFVLGFITGIQLTGVIPIGGGITVRVYGGPAADLRIVLVAIGLNHPNDFTGGIENNARLQTNAISDYFWGEGRWFMPVAGAGMDFPINEKFLLGFDLRTWFPVYKLWTNDQTPAIDGWRFGAGLRITPRLGT